MYVDNVGGEHLEAAIELMRIHGRIAVCGMISQYNGTEPAAAPRNLRLLSAKRFTIRGMLVTDHLALRPRFTAEMAPLVRESRLWYAETVVDGIANAPRAFLDMLHGANTGKMLVRVGQD